VGRVTVSLRKSMMRFLWRASSGPLYTLGSLSQQFHEYFV
jgi:hypothetical protein